jgi:hypothetical protein
VRLTKLSTSWEEVVCPQLAAHLHFQVADGALWAALTMEYSTLSIPSTENFPSCSHACLLNLNQQGMTA